MVKASKLIDLELRASFNGNRAPIIKSDKPNSKIICRCEGITEMEIIDGLNRGITVDSIEAVKRRTRAGMGNCQGNYCGPRVRALLAERLNKDISQIKTRTETHAAPIRVSIDQIRKLRV